MKQKRGSFKITVLIATKMNVKYMRKEFAKSYFKTQGLLNELGLSYEQPKI